MSNKMNSNKLLPFLAVLSVSALASCGSGTSSSSSVPILPGATSSTSSATTCYEAPMYNQCLVACTPTTGMSTNPYPNYAYLQTPSNGCQLTEYTTTSTTTANSTTNWANCPNGEVIIEGQYETTVGCTQSGQANTVVYNTNQGCYEYTGTSIQCAN